MKKKEIISICKKSNYLYRGIYDEVQWIGTGTAVFPLFDLPIMTDNQLLNFLDIEESKQEKYAFYDVFQRLNEWLDDSLENDKEIVSKKHYAVIGRSKIASVRHRQQRFCFYRSGIIKTV